MGEPRIIIGVLSGIDCRRRRAACLATWAADVAHFGSVDLVFLLGDPEAESPYREDKLLFLPCPDDYDHLPQKTRWFCEWAVTQPSFDYLFKCDDDTYLRIDRLLAADHSAPYVGHDIAGYASGGAGYLLNRRAAEIIAGGLRAKAGYEDIEVAKTLATEGIRLTADSRFYPWPLARFVPRSGNQLISGHGWMPEQMLRIHQRFSAAGS